jgi:hypothetical protein
MSGAFLMDHCCENVITTTKSVSPRGLATSDQSGHQRTNQAIGTLDERLTDIILKSHFQAGLLSAEHPIQNINAARYSH